MAHLVQEVKPVVAGSPVRTEAYVDAFLQHACHRRHAARELEVRGWTVGHAAAVPGERRNLMRFEVHRVHGDQSGAQQTRTLQTLDWAYLMRCDTFLNF